MTDMSLCILRHDEIHVVLEAMGPEAVATLAGTSTFWRSHLRNWRANQSCVAMPFPRPVGLALRVVGRHYARLRELDAAGCRPIINDDILFVVASCPSLKKLDLSQCPIRALPRVLDYLRKIRPDHADISSLLTGLDANVVSSTLVGRLRTSVDAIRPGVELVYIPADIELTMVIQDGREIWFKCQMTTPLNKLMRAVCARLGVSVRSARFMFDGIRLVDCEVTPEQMRIEDGDKIDVLCEFE